MEVFADLGIVVNDQYLRMDEFRRWRVKFWAGAALFGQGDGETEDRPAGGFAGDGEGAAHLSNEVFGDGQAETGAAMAALDGLVGLVETFEDVLLVFWRDADAGVADGKADDGIFLVLLVDTDREDDFALGGEFDCVVEEAEYGLLQVQFVAVDE